MTYHSYSFHLEGLEDEFDGANRRNLRNFIVAGEAIFENKSDLNEDPICSGGSDIEVAEPEGAISLATSSPRLFIADDKGQPTRPLAVLPIMAIFHKFASGKGVPHTFVGFLSQYPALPRVVVSFSLYQQFPIVQCSPTRNFQIFLSVRVTTLARIPPGQRFIVNKVRSLDG